MAHLRILLSMLAIFLVAAGMASGSAMATDVQVVGLFPARAVVSINGGAPRTMSVGQSTEGVRLVAVETDAAVLEIQGRRRTLRIGQYAGGAATGSTQEKVVLRAGHGGHFMADGAVNGGSTRFLVDTGATSIALPGAEARRLGLDYRNGQRGMVQTANGATTAYRVKLDTVAIGGISINNVDAVVIESGLTVPLLGMSFLGRTTMINEGETLTLTKRY